jgi:hypothetical protein
MFDPAEAFSIFSGEYTADELQRTLETMRSRFAAALPAELNTRDLADLAYANDWLKPSGNGKYVLEVTSPQPLRHHA